jgi:hypothetical protein
MAAFLTDAQKTILDWVVTYSEQSPIDKPADQKIVEELSKLHAKLGYDGDISFQEAMRDRPIHTLIKAIQYLNANA